MKKSSKALLILLSVGFLCMGADPTTLVVQAQECIQENQTISPRSDIIDWRYKVVDGYLYRRQFNYSKEVWIGEWEPC